MKQNNLNWFIVVCCVVAWAIYQIIPPTNGDLIAHFAEKGKNQDAAFQQIVKEAQTIAAPGTNTPFASLQEALGTNELQKYFTSINASNQVRPNLYILNRLQREVSGKIKLGIDLQGGTAYVMEMQTNVLATGTNEASQADVAGAINQAVEVLRKRVDKFGVAEPVIQPAGNNQILVQLPGLSPSDKAQAETNLQASAYLEFRMVHEHSSELVDSRTGQLLGAIPPGYEVLRPSQPKADEPKAYVVKKAPASHTAPDYLAGDIISRAQGTYDNMGSPEIYFELTPDAGKKFGEITENNVGRDMAIILDGVLYSAPQIKDAILTGSGTISGHFTPEEIRTLVNVLQNPLRAPLHIISSKDVGPTLGKDNIQRGINASMYAVIFVSLFMLCYYFLAGLAANIALITNVVILLGVMCAAGTTFTLPGIAGAVLTVGMAVDANVLIYERIREELAKGKSLRGAIDAGYGRAFGTIFDSHVTTLISSIILIWLGTGEIKGFGVTLTIGVAASLFTALVVTRLIFNFLTDRNIIKSLPMLHIIRSSSIPFMQVAKPLFYATWVLAIAAICFGFGTKGSSLFGIDFRGGDNIVFSFTQKPSPDEVRNVLAGIGQKDAMVQYQSELSTKTETLSITASAGTATNVVAALADKLPQAHFQKVGGFTVGATVGEEIRSSAAISCLIAMLGILVYVAFRYEYSFAVAAVLAVLHDVLLTVGIYCLIPERQFGATSVAAVLTIIGFSINDKIVIFDRIREDLKLGMRGSFKEVINAALNQTLSRTIITSGTVFIATAVLFFYGGGAINDFALIFLIGIITGTYSSVFVASYIVLKWHKEQRPDLGASPVTVQNPASAKV